MKTILKLIMFLLTLTTLQSQTNEPNELVNLALLDDATVVGNIENGRGTPSDILYDPKTNKYKSSSTSFNEYGVNFNKTFSYHGENDLVLSFSWTELKNVNYITFAGTYPNQPQEKTSWLIQYKGDGSWQKLDEGVGGWINSGIYEWKSENLIPIKVKEIRLYIFEETQGDAKSVHLRGRGVLNNYEDQDSIKATLIQYLKPETKPMHDVILFKDKYRVYKNDSLVFEHNDQTKARNFASNTKQEDPESYVELKQPTMIYEEGEGGHTIALIKVIKSRAKRVMQVNKPIKDIEYGNGCDSNETFIMVSEVPFDFKGIPVILNNASWFITKGLLNNGEKITDLEAWSKGLIVMKCNNSQVVIKK